MALFHVEDAVTPAFEANRALAREAVAGAEVIRDRRLTQARAAKLPGVPQPRVSDVARGRVEKFTIDALVEMLARAGVRLDLVRLPAAS